MGIARETWDYWTKPGLGERLGSLFGDNAPAGAERVTKPGKQIDRQVEEQTGTSSGDGSSSAPSDGDTPSEPRGKARPEP